MGADETGEKGYIMPNTDSYGYHCNRSSRANTEYADFRFYHTDRRNHRVAHEAGSALHMGFEVETDNYQGSYNGWHFVSEGRENAIRFLSENYDGLAKPTDDGSLDNGFEIVSAPMTLSAHQATEWKALFDKVTECGGHSHDTTTCGFHVHVSRAALGNDDKAKALCIGKIVTLLSKFQRNFSCLARREPHYRWSQPIPTQYRPTDTDGTRAIIRKANALQSFQGLGVHDDNRYYVLNLQNVNTIEFRLFKGTLNADTFYATLALVDGIVRWCKQHTTVELHSVTFDEIIEWIADEKLTNYWSTRRASLNRYSD